VCVCVCKSTRECIFTYFNDVQILNNFLNKIIIYTLYKKYIHLYIEMYYYLYVYLYKNVVNGTE